MPHLSQRFRFDLSDALSRDTELPSYFLERPAVSIHQAEALFQNLPFAIAISQSRPGGVMCSYNQINGVYACENPVLTNILRGEDGFGGYVVSDFGAVHSTASPLR